MQISETKNIKIHEYLKALGIEPVRQRGVNLWFHAPYRDDKNPSFSVNTEKNLWYDLVGYGGDLIELVKLIYNCNTSQALKNIEQIEPVPFNFSFDCSSSHGIHIKKVQPLQNIALIKYVQSRGINAQIAAHYLHEVYYTVNSHNYFACGFKNNSEGYELRNRTWKGSIAPKDIATISNKSDECCVFEGFFDFLSYLQYLRKQPKDYLILNSVMMVKRAIGPLKKYLVRYYFGQNDQPGQSVLNTLRKEGLTMIDCRHQYTECKDLNAKYQVL